LTCYDSQNGVDWAALEERAAGILEGILEERAVGILEASLEERAGVLEEKAVCKVRVLRGNGANILK
jgi:hypothetical protein